ncbi:MAG: type II toxin-antitoxin system VapC family toxin [Vulcanococcus sp.]|uniref:type II toxin-antitoxin system VapC family toxin n=1 Tax=Vulcanococcus sp. TaxID=2856995 RepID=UPI0025ED7675|nr:type II toxin-antitoxin system VapC family toxin [Vulcanococcus sp.]MBW0173606.1 type II toxin-antitoxin system VapC family toxin [Vulcanococcus sp.]MBW0180945.1 type II toxin-antitoxin system VapC family toxin [Vulcanococcus sp.]
MTRTLQNSRLYGRGHHGGALEPGDCFRYGQSKDLDAPLLFKGEDFHDTDPKVAP